MNMVDTRPGYIAYFVSPYINTTGKCLELFYWIREEPPDNVETELVVNAVSEELRPDILFTVSELTDDFMRLYLRLPNGKHRIAIEGHRSSKEKFCAISLDDVTLMDCSRFGKTNVYIEIKLKITFTMIL